MKVALDATPLDEAAGGIRRYTAELANALERCFPAARFELLKDEGGRWWSSGLPRRLKQNRFDLFHGTDFAVPYRPVCATVLTLHDLTPCRAAFRSEISARVRRRLPWLLRFGLATMVITPTEAVRREAIETLGLNPEEVVAVPEAASPHFHPTHTSPPAKPYFLVVGKRGARKNLEVIEQAIRHVPAAGLLITDGAVEESELPALYSNAVAVLYPSLYEGFGLPLVEAMQCGTPVIASRDPALLEVSGGACLHAPADDIRAWVQLMAMLLEQPGQRARLREASLRRAADFSWDKTALLTREVYRTALRRFHG